MGKSSIIHRDTNFYKGTKFWNLPLQILDFLKNPGRTPKT